MLFEYISENVGFLEADFYEIMGTMFTICVVIQICDHLNTRSMSLCTQLQVKSTIPPRATVIVFVGV